jgi:hypothetical protein
MAQLGAGDATKNFEIMHYLAFLEKIEIWRNWKILGIFLYDDVNDDVEPHVS